MKKILFIALMAFSVAVMADFSICPDEHGWSVCDDDSVHNQVLIAYIEAGQELRTYVTGENTQAKETSTAAKTFNRFSPLTLGLAPYDERGWRT